MFSSIIGLFHTYCAVMALASGAIVLFGNKGTRRHKTVGYIYVVSMISLNLTALFTHSLYRFGPFHWAALFSLITVLLGIMAPLAMRERKYWIAMHYEFMLWSYVGLIAALFSEIIVRVPVIVEVVGGGAIFWVLVIGTSIFISTIGGYLIYSRRARYVVLRSGS